MAWKKSRRDDKEPQPKGTDKGDKPRRRGGIRRPRQCPPHDMQLRRVTKAIVDGKEVTYRFMVCGSCGLDAVEIS